MSKNESRKILLIDDDENLLDSLAEFFELALDMKCIRSRGLDDAIARKSEIFAGEVVAAILDINLGVGVPNGLDAYQWLRSQGFHGKIAFLTGHAKDHPLVRKVAEIEGVRIFEKPMDVNEIVAMIESH